MGIVFFHTAHISFAFLHNIEKYWIVLFLYCAKM